jgi:hypothetical protein
MIIPKIEEINLKKVTIDSKVYIIVNKEDVGFEDDGMPTIEICPGGYIFEFKKKRG